MKYDDRPQRQPDTKLMEAESPSGNNTSRISLGGSGGYELYEYNGFNQQVSANISGTVTTYAYRPDGLRRRKVTDGVATYHYWDGDKLSMDWTSSVENQIDGSYIKFVQGVNLIASVRAKALYVNNGGTMTIQTVPYGDMLYYLYNAHGDVVQLTDESGSVVKSYDYDAFGVEREPEEDDANPYRYCGEYFDRETGTVYLRARYYDPRTGRFTQQDVWEYGDPKDSLSLNLYTYCVNNPLRFIDPNGNVHHKQQSDGGYTNDPNTMSAKAQQYFNQYGTGTYRLDVHTLLDALGFIPGIGDVLDLGNGVLYLVEGDYTNAALSAISVVPIIGDIVGKGGKTAIKVTDKVIDAAKVAGKAGDAVKAGAKSTGSIVSNIGSKISKQLSRRGWSADSIDNVVNNAYTTRAAANKATGNTATAYYNKAGDYVVRDNVTGDIIQISEYGNKGWIPDTTIKNPYKP